VPKLRPVRPASRRLVHVLTGTVAAAVVLVPGTAWAAGDGASSTDPVSGVVQQGNDALTQVVGGALGGDSQTAAGNGSGADPNAAVTDAAPAVDTPPPPALPPQLQAVLDQLSLSSPCATAIQADLTKTLTDIPSLVTGVLAALQGAGSNPDPQTVLAAIGQALGLGELPGNTSAGDAGAADAGSTPTPDLPADLQQLVKDLSSCLQPPAPTSTPPADNPPVTGVDDQGTPPQVVAQPETAQPVSYPGYAATGSIAPASADHSAGTAPLAALGGGVLLVSAAATAAVRSRARRAGR
jgi:hypothetical protein